MNMKGRNCSHERFHKGSIIMILDAHMRFSPKFPALRH
jgi:hypothetical protein